MNKFLETETIAICEGCGWVGEGTLQESDYVLIPVGEADLICPNCFDIDTIKHFTNHYMPLNGITW